MEKASFGRAQVLSAEHRRPSVQLELLRTFRLVRADRAVDLPTGPQRLVALLALRGRPQRRTSIAGTLWPEAPEPRSSANLRSALWRLRRLDPQVVISKGDVLFLADGVEVDVRRIERRARHVLEGIGDAREPLPSADELVAELLPGWYDDWVLLEQERYRQFRLHALEALCMYLTTRHQYSDAIQAGLAAVNSEPLRESAHRVLITAYLAEGNVSEAAHQYASCRQILRRELGIEPSAPLRLLFSDPE